jgi:hypothetical protein
MNVVIPEEQKDKPAADNGKSVVDDSSSAIKILRGESAFTKTTGKSR